MVLSEIESREARGVHQAWARIIESSSKVRNDLLLVLGLHGSGWDVFAKLEFIGMPMEHKTSRRRIDCVVSSISDYIQCGACMMPTQKGISGAPHFLCLFKLRDYLKGRIKDHTRLQHFGSLVLQIKLKPHIST